MFRTLPSKAGPPEGSIQAHVEAAFGPVQEFISVDKDVQILRAEDPRWGCLRLVTQGMSRQAMRTADGQEIHLELMLSLVPGTATTWPIEVLGALAQYPFANNTYFHAGHIVENHGFPECPYPHFLIGPSMTAPEQFTLSTLGLTRTMFLAVYPLYEEEAQLRKDRDPGALQRRLDRFKINDLVQDARLNSCDPALDRCETCLEQARAATRKHDPAAASQHLMEAGQLFEDLLLPSHALAVYQLAGEGGAQAHDRLKRFGARLDPEFFEETQRRLMGLDFPALTPKQVQFGQRLVKRIDQKTEKLFRLMLEDPTRLGEYPEGMLAQFQELVKPQAERWVKLASTASLWCLLNAARDRKDNAELAYRAVLSQGDERSDQLMDLDSLAAELQGREAELAGDDPATRAATRAALYVWSRLEPGDWSAVLEKKAPVTVTAGALVLANRIVGPKLLG